MIVAIFVAILAVIGNAESAELKDFYIEAEKAVMNNRVYEMANPYARDASLNLGFNIDLTPKVYWDNRIESNIDNRGFFQTVAWKFELGRRLSENLEIYYGHRSGHALDGRNVRVQADPFNGFPEVNSIGLRWYFK